MLKYIMTMIIPLIILIYTLSFGHWIQRRQRQWQGALSAYMLGVLAFAVSGVVLWRMLT